jgi:hypothetical protein
MNNKPQTTEQPSSFSENWVPKVGDVLIAIDPCVMEGTNAEALTVGREYVIKGVLGNDFWVALSANDKNYLGVSEYNWQKFFKLKPTATTPFSPSPIPKKRYFIVGFAGEAPNGMLVVKSVNRQTFGNFASRNDFVQSVMTLYPELTNIQILSISELSETDYKQFYGEE